MNATLQHLRRLGQSVLVSLGTPATPAQSGSPRASDNAQGSYGRGIYASRSTFTLDFRTQGSYGHGSYAGYSTADCDYDTPGSYGRGSYAGYSTADCDFGTQGRFAGDA